LPSKVLHNKSPYDILYNSSPDLAFIKVFGCEAFTSTLTDLAFIKVFACEAFTSTLTHNKKKLDPKARRCVYLGHRPQFMGSL